jgi:hypothetical protein
MKAIAWGYNGSNDDNYGGLFTRWGLGLHHTNLSPNYAICSSISSSFIGHPGEAYGLISDNYFIEGNDVSFSLLINGVQQGYQIGTSAFYTIEEDIFGAVCDHINQLLSIGTIKDLEVLLIPNPATSSITIKLPSAFSNSEIIILDITGKTLKYSKAIDTESIELALTGLPTGIYFIRVNAGISSSIQKLIIE